MHWKWFQRRTVSLLTDQSSTSLNVKNVAQVNQSVKINTRKNAKTYNRNRFDSNDRFVVNDAQLRTAAIDANPSKNEGNETTHMRFYALREIV